MDGQRGFTYLGVLLLVALMGGALAAAGQLWSPASQRDRERDLLWIGNQYALALPAPAGDQLPAKSITRKPAPTRHRHGSRRPHHEHCSCKPLPASKAMQLCYYLPPSFQA